jgi:parallel beta-helix repeat protein
VNETGSGGAYMSIQDAINASSDGDTVYVYNGTYNENVVVNKSINLIGEDRETSIIYGLGNGDVVSITVDFVYVTDFTFTNSGGFSDDAGIKLDNVQNCRVINNKVFGNSDGINLQTSSLNYIEYNYMSSNIGSGIFLIESSDNTISRNNATNNYGEFYLFNSNGNIVENNSMSFSIGRGISIDSSSNGNFILNNTILSNDDDGIYVYWSDFNTIMQNDIISSINGDGIYLYWGDSNTIKNNNITRNINGIYLEASNNNNFVSNTISSNTNVAIFAQGSNGNVITDNTISSNDATGINLGSCDNGAVTGNIVSMNDIGITLIGGSSGYRIYHNNIINNRVQAVEFGSFSQWDNGYPTGGNFWSDYDGLDLNSTPAQNVPPPDGLGDTPYVIDSDSQDDFPLMNPFGNYIFLREGWNLVSIPFIQTDTILSQVLSSIKGAYNAVQWLNATDPADPWKHNSTSKPSHLNDLENIDHTIGFWIHIIEPGGALFEYLGTKPSSNQSIILHSGWNMVGNPSLTNHNRTEGLNNLTFNVEVDAIWTFDAALQKWEEIGINDFFEPGRGYWIHATTKCEWEVPL